MALWSSPVEGGVAPIVFAACRIVTSAPGGGANVTR